MQRDRIVERSCGGVAGSPLDSAWPSWSANSVTNPTCWRTYGDDSWRTLPDPTETSIDKEELQNIAEELQKCIIKESTEKANKKTAKTENTTKHAAVTKRLRVKPAVKKDGAKPPTLVFEGSRDQYKAWTGGKCANMYKTCKVTAERTKAAAANECRQWLRTRCKALGLACTI